MLKIKIPKYLGKKWLSTKPCRNLKEILNSVCDNWQQFQNCQPNITESKTFSSIYQHSKNAMLWSPKLQLPLLQMEEHRWRVSFKKSPTNSSSAEMVTTIAAAAGFSEFQRDTLYTYIRPLCLMKLSSETLGNLPCFLE